MMLKQQDVVDDIVARLANVPNIRGPAKPDSRIVEDLNMDSLTIMDFIMALEDHYDVALPLDRLAKIKTVTELAQLIVHLDQGRPAP
jgi:acyl carrier protein